jgi:hypothetical protein
MQVNLDRLVYLNDDVVYLRNKRIIEYDIVEGGYSVARNEKLLSRDFLRRLARLDKKRRHIEIGIYSGEHKEFTKSLFAGFRKYVKLFREENGVENEKVLSIKKDSITLYDTNIETTRFGEYVEFTLRETATSYLLLGKKEFFLNSKTGKFWYKGFDSELDPVETLLEEVRKVLEFAEYKDRRFLFEYIKEIRQAYVGRELCHSYYKELGPNAAYRLTSSMKGYTVFIEHADDESVDDLDISYNYENILLPLIRIII